MSQNKKLQKIRANTNLYKKDKVLMVPQSNSAITILQFFNLQIFNNLKKFKTFLRTSFMEISPR